MIQFLKNFLCPVQTPLRLVLNCFAAPALILAIIFFAAIEPNAITKSSWALTRNDIQRAKMIVSTSSSDEQNSIDLSEKDLNIALSYLLSFYMHSTSKITIENDRLSFKIALLLKKNLIGKYLNLTFYLTKQHGYPAIKSLKIGNIEIADEFAGLIIKSIIKYTPLRDYYILAARHIRDIQIKPSNGLTISYLTSKDLNLKNKLGLGNNNHQSVIFYQQKISEILAEHDPKWRLSLAQLLQPLFKLAYQRSSESNAILENRSVLIAISSYVNKRQIQAYIPFYSSPTTDKQYEASMYRRSDMAKHFMASAVLAASGAGTVANMLGQEKELSDAKRGSGFSFIDLAGDRAGLNFGKKAVADPAQARELQAYIANISDYKAFMPDVRDLPENMDANTFKKEYESIYSAKYQNMLKIIDQRIAKLPLYNL